MENITNGMTPAEFIAALNGNYEQINDAVSSSMTSVELFEEINNNITKWNNDYSLTCGTVSSKSGLTFSLVINSNNTLLPQQLAAKLRDNLIDALAADEDEVGVLRADEKMAIYNLIYGLKDAGIFTKIKAIYPMLGTSIHQVKYNLINPANTDEAFRLEFIEEESTINAKFVNGYIPITGGTFRQNLSVGTELLGNNFHLSFYSNYNKPTDGGNVFGQYADAAHNMQCILSQTGKVVFVPMPTRRAESVAINNTEGYYIFNSKEAVNIFKNGVKLDEELAVDGSGLAAISNYVGGLNSNNNISNPSAFKTSLVTAGLGLTDAEAILLSEVAEDFNHELGRYDENDLDLKVLDDEGTFEPATESNENLARYKNFRLGGLIHFSIYTWSYVFTRPANPLLYNLSSIDVDAWVAGAAAAGAEYVGLTIHDTSGFALFDNPITFPDYIRNKTWSYKKFDVAVTEGDKNIVDKFFTACQKYGVEPMPYMCTVSNTNLAVMRGATWMDATGFQYYDNYCAAVMQYIMKTWNPRYFWLDVAGAQVLNDMQVFYDAIKAENQNCIIIGNVVGDIQFDWFPYDIGSNEEYYSLRGDTQTWEQVMSTVRTKNAKQYYIPQEIVTNINSGGSGASYYWNEQALRSQSEVQAIYSIARLYNAPFLLSLAPNRNGVIPQAQFDIFSNLT